MTYEHELDTIMVNRHNYREGLTRAMECSMLTGKKATLLFEILKAQDDELTAKVEALIQYFELPISLSTIQELP